MKRVRQPGVFPRGGRTCGRPVRLAEPPQVWQCVPYIAAHGMGLCPVACLIAMRPVDAAIFPFVSAASVLWPRGGWAAGLIDTVNGAFR